VQTTPLSIAALSGDTLAKTGATQLADYFRQVPNLNVTSAQGGSSRISIRGVNAAGEATVGLYYDETPVTGPSGTTQDSGGVAADINLRCRAGGGAARAAGHAVWFQLDGGHAAHHLQQAQFQEV
jgi:hypothetical protein